MNYLLTGNAPGRIGNCHPNIVPYQLFHTKDAPIIVAVGNDGQFQKLCTVLECPEFIEDPRYTTNSARVEHREQLIPELQNRFETRSQSEWLAALEAQKIPCGPVLSIDHAIEHPQAQHRGMKVTAPHVLGSDTPMLRSPLHFSETPVCDPQAPPTLGQHTGTILRDTLGFSEEDITTLKKKGVV